MAYAPRYPLITMATMSTDAGPEEIPPLPRALRILWSEDDADARSRGLSRRRIVAAAIDLADADGLAALSMARLAERLGCGTMSLYRHVANKDELVTFMVSASVASPPGRPDGASWRDALTAWAQGLWDVYHRHPWILPAVSVPPADPGQLAWLDAGLATLSEVGLSEADKLSAVMAILHFVRGAAALDIAAAHHPGETDYPAVLRELVTPARFPALNATLRAGVFDADEDRRSTFRSGLDGFLDGVAARIRSR